MTQKIRKMLEEHEDKMAMLLRESIIEELDVIDARINSLTQQVDGLVMELKRGD